MASLGKKIKEIRIANKKSQKEIADIACVDRTLISKIESDKATPSEDFLQLFCKSFNIKVLIDKIEKNNINIIIIAVVIQEEALKKLDKYQILTIRTSKNKFIGAKVKKQTGNKGPDTSDRLFNML